MVDKVFRAPINLYFDVTPIGRVLNKFTKDMSTWDTEIAWSYGSGLVQAYQVLGGIIVTCVTVPWVLFLVPFVGAAAVYYFRKVITAYKETTRIESLTRSPLVSFLSEVYMGNATIRAYNKE